MSGLDAGTRLSAIADLLQGVSTDTGEMGRTAVAAHALAIGLDRQSVIARLREARQAGAEGADDALARLFEAGA